MTSELGCDDVSCDGCDTPHYIEEFTSTGPKSYSYKTNNGYCCMKCKGITLNYTNKQKIDFDTMKSMVLQTGPKEIEFNNPHKIVRNKLKTTLEVKSESKSFRVAFDKRIRLGEYTEPYGY